MASLAKYIRLVLGALAFLLVVGASAPSNAQQVNPTASSVKEQQLLQELNRIEGRVSIPDQRSGVLEQPAGRDWREFRNVTLRWIGGLAILGVVALLLIFFLSRRMGRARERKSTHLDPRTPRVFDCGLSLQKKRSRRMPVHRRGRT